MLTKRIIPCLDVDKGRVVKGVNFVDIIDAGDPVECAKAYDAMGADELVFLDITASHERRDTILEVAERTAECCFMPLTIGGGIRTVEDIRTTLRAGALQHYLDHIQHAVDVCGIDHVGIGSDRDHRFIELTEEYLDELRAEQGANLNEDDLPWFMEELNGPRRMETIWDGLKSRNLSDDDAEKIMGANVRRIYAETIG